MGLHTRRALPARVRLRRNRGASSRADLRGRARRSDPRLERDRRNRRGSRACRVRASAISASSDSEGHRETAAPVPARGAGARARVRTADDPGRTAATPTVGSGRSSGRTSSAGHASFASEGDDGRSRSIRRLPADRPGDSCGPRRHHARGRCGHSARRIRPPSRCRRLRGSSSSSASRRTSGHRDSRVPPRSRCTPVASSPRITAALRLSMSFELLREPEPGQILVSHSTEALLEGERLDPWQLRDLGERLVGTL